MKLRTPNLSETAQARLTRVYGIFRAVMIKAIPVIIFAFILSQVAILIDQKSYRDAPADDFLKYTEFSVQNARENEDVYFKVCRDRVSNIQYDGDLSIYIIANADKPDESKAQVYSRDIGGTIQNDCENKVIRASDFKHNVGTYEMGFCVRFKVKYGYEKEQCKTSNRYRIYSQPQDVDTRIRDLEQQLESARQERADAGGNINGAQDNSLAVPRVPINNDTTAQTPSNNGGNSNSGNNGNNGGGSGTGVTPPSCSVNLIFGIGVGCGSDGLIRL